MESNLSSINRRLAHTRAQFVESIITKLEHPKIINDAIYDGDVLLGTVSMRVVRDGKTVTFTYFLKKP